MHWHYSQWKTKSKNVEKNYNGNKVGKSSNSFVGLRILALGVDWMLSLTIHEIIHKHISTHNNKESEQQ